MRTSHPGFDVSPQVVNYVARAITASGRDLEGAVNRLLAHATLTGTAVTLETAETAIRDLVKNSLRMRPDRIVVGEIRDAAALDMLQAMNTGHDGSISTLHANTPRDALARLETMVLMAGMDLPVRAIREQVSSAVDLIIQQTRLKDGTRRITAVTEIVGMEGDIITTQDVFLFDYAAGTDDLGRFKGGLKSTGLRPRFIERLRDHGVHLDPAVFATGTAR